MQQIEQAIRISFAGSHVGVDQHVKENAESYLAACKREPGHCSTCISLLESTTKPEVQFWCLKSVLEVVTGETFSNASQQEVGLIKAAATKWAFAEDGVALRAAPFVQNKLAQLLAALASQLYPDQWPNFFTDMLAARSHNAAHANMFTRVLLALDADIISLDIPRSDAESRRSMAFKDAMRVRDVGPVVHACVEMVAQQHREAPELVALVLAVLQRYADWVDIHLVVTQALVSLLYQLLRGGSSQGGLQGAAAATLASVLSKRMEPQPKLQLIVQLDAAAAAEQWENIAAPAGELDEPLAEQLTSFLNVLASETIESVKRIENQVISMQALGVEVDTNVSGEAGEALTVGQQLLARVMPPVLRTLAYESSTVCLSCMQFLNSFLARVKNVCKRQGGLDETAQQQLLMIMQGLAVAARYPRDSVSRAGLPDNQEEALLAQEQEKEMDEERQELFVLLRNTAKLIPKQSIASVHTLLQSFIHPADDRGEGGVGVLPGEGGEAPAWQDVEVAVSLLYALGEALTDEVNADRGGLFQQPVALLMSGTIPHLEHRHVAGAVLECCVRYVKVASQNPPLVLPVMKMFLRGSGLSHPHDAHATRACYLFMRIVKVLRPQLQEHLEELIQGLIPVIMRIVTNPIQASSHALKATVARGAPGSTLQLDDRLYAWEAMGLLLATDSVPQDAQASYVQGLLQQLCTQIRSNLERDTSAIAVMGSSPPPRPSVRSSAWLAPRAIPTEAMRINHALEAVSRLSKGFSLERMNRLRPKIGELFMEVVPVALLVPTKLPKNKLLRARFISYLHRMVECLGGQLLPMLPQTLAALLHHDCDVWDMCSALRVVYQLVVKFPADISDLLKELLPSIVFKVHEMLPDSWDWTGAAAAAQSGADGGRTGSTSEILELSDLQNTYFALLGGLVANDLLYVVPQGEALNHAMTAFVQGASSHVDVSQRKLCIAALVKLLKVWGSEAWFKQYAIDSIGIQCCVAGMVSGGVDVRDGGVLGLLTEVSTGIKSLYSLYGDEFMAALKRCMEQDTVQAHKESTLKNWVALLHSVQTEDTKQIKDAMKALMRDKQGVVSRIPQRNSEPAG